MTRHNYIMSQPIGVLWFAIFLSLPPNCTVIKHLKQDNFMTVELPDIWPFLINISLSFNVVVTR